MRVDGEKQLIISAPVLLRKICRLIPFPAKQISLDSPFNALGSEDLACKKNFLPIQIEDETLCYAADRWECACSCSVSQCHKQISVAMLLILLSIHPCYILFILNSVIVVNMERYVSILSDNLLGHILKNRNKEGTG